MVIRLLFQVTGLVKMTSLSEALGKNVDFHWAVERFISGMSDYFPVRLVPKVFSTEERDSIQKIQADRYENPDWTYRRKFS